MNARFRHLSSRRLLALTLLLAAGLLLSACGGVAGDSWAGVGADPQTQTVYVANNDHVVALNPLTGETVWKYAPEGTRFYAVPTVEDGTVFVGDWSGSLHAIDTTTGQAKWVYTPERDTLVGPISTEPTDRVIGGAAVGPDYIYFGLGSRNVVAISRETHDAVWTFKTSHGVWSAPVYIAANADAGIAQDMLLVASLDHHLYAVDAASGHELWHVNLGGAAPGGITYDAERNRVYIGTFVSEVVVVDLASQRIVDRYKAEDWVWGRPALDGDRLYFGDLAGNLYAVQITDQGLKKVWMLPVAEDAIRATPIVADDMVIASSRDKHVYAVNKTDGGARWSKPTDGEALTNLVYVAPSGTEETPAGNLVVVGTTNKDKLVMAYAVNTGEPGWNYSD